MTKNTSLAWSLGIACLSLLTAIAVYNFARFQPPALIEPFKVTNSMLAAQTLVFGSAPSFFYTLALGLFTGVCALSLTQARLYCLLWVGLALCLEISQHVVFAEFISNWIMADFSDSTRALIGPYWARGVFDPLDLLATLMGGGIALYLLTRFGIGEKQCR
jgi:hypothetical protein